MANEPVNCKIEHHAILFAYLAKRAIEICGEEGKEDVYKRQAMSLEKFTEEYIAWAEEKKYHRSRSKAEAVYELASSGIPTPVSYTHLISETI